MSSTSSCSVTNQGLLVTARRLRAAHRHQHDRRPHDLPVPGGDPDPGADAHLRAEDGHHLRRAGGARALDRRELLRFTEMCFEGFPSSTDGLARGPLEAVPQTARRGLNYTQELLIVALVLARTMPMVIQTPFLGGKLAPPEIKMALGVMLTIVLWPVARGAIAGPLPTDPVPFLLLMVKEVFIGTTIGYVNSLVFSVMEMAGRLIDTARGSSMAEVIVPHSGGRATPFGDLYYQLFLVLFVAVGGPGVFFEAFFYSFASIPLTSACLTPFD